MLKSKRARGSSKLVFELAALEKRLLFAAHAPHAPAAVTAASPLSVLTKAQRQDLLNHFDSTNKATLQGLLDANKPGAFDTQLLSYMLTRSGPSFFYDSSNVSNYASYITGHFDVTGTIGNADDIVNHLFPEQTNATSNTIQLAAGDIDWATQPASTNNPEFLHSLNRHGYWLDLSQAYSFTGDPKYVTELTSELASWSTQNPPLADINSWRTTDPKWWLEDTSIRAQTWTWSYFQLLGSADWTPAANSLFLYELYQHGDFLYRVTPESLASNHTITQGKGLLELSTMFPEFTGAATWRTYARNLLFSAAAKNLYSDGSGVEQSPGYSLRVVEDLLESKLLDEKNGATWPTAESDRISSGITSYWQMLSPDGYRPAISDTYRNVASNFFLKADLIQGTTQWPAAKPRVNDVWLFGPTTTDPYMSNPGTPALGARGKTYASTASGYYMMRSDDTASARQIIFDAGPKGGTHGHYDPLNFELEGYGRTLISDPGPYKYDNSADRAYVISTRAHNTINVDGQNAGAMEGEGNPGLAVSQWDTDGSTFAQITATHHGYQYLAGGPVVTRSIWYDLDGTMVVVDWGEGQESHTFQQSFNLPTGGDSTNITGVQPDGSFRSRFASGGNVQIQPVARTGQTVARGPLTFVTNQAAGDYKDDDYRFTVTQAGTFVCFVTLITTYNGTTPPDTTATLINTPTPGHGVMVQLTKGGVSQILSFVQSPLERLPANAANNGSYNDIAYDSSGRLHYAWFDRTSMGLKYAVRGTNGKWSIAQMIDPPVSTVGAGAYQFFSLATDSNGNPGVAYFDGWNGDLKYAHLDPFEHDWEVTTVEWKGSTGLYPSLAFSRNNGPVISYYNRTKGDLNVAFSAGTGFSITPIDTTGDVGRFTTMMLDPNRPTVSKFAIGYSDTTHGTYKYAIQGLLGGGEQLNGFTNYTVDPLPIAGGYTSLAFYDSGSNDTRRYKPAMSYYDTANSALKLAKAIDGVHWTTQTVANKGVQGLYTQLYFTSTNKANIFYFDKTNNRALRAAETGTGWSITSLGQGGREIHLALNPGSSLAWTNLDETAGNLSVNFI